MNKYIISPESFNKQILKHKPPSKTRLKDIISQIAHLSDLGLQLNDILRNEIFSVVPFQSNGSTILINAARSGEFRDCAALIRMKHNMVFDFDYTG